MDSALIDSFGKCTPCERSRRTPHFSSRLLVVGRAALVAVTPDHGVGFIHKPSAFGDACPQFLLIGFKFARLAVAPCGPMFLVGNPYSFRLPRTRAPPSWSEPERISTNRADFSSVAKHVANRAIVVRLGPLNRSAIVGGKDVLGLHDGPIVLGKLVQTVMLHHPLPRGGDHVPGRARNQWKWRSSRFKDRRRKRSPRACGCAP